MVFGKRSVRLLAVRQRRLVFPIDRSWLAVVNILCRESFVLFPILLRTTFGTDCHELEYLPEDFGNICKLAVLDLSGCYKIKVLLETFCQLMGLKDLNLSDCHGLQQLHESFGDLSEIQSLNLTSCSKLRTLPHSLFKIHKLKHLNLSYCISLIYLPSSFDSISKMTSLIELNIATGQQRVLDKVQSIREHLNLPRAIKHDVHEMENVGSSSIVELGRLHCHELIVHWEHGGIRNVDKDKLVPENLVPPRTLESFGLYGYMCKDFPTWVSGISSYLPYLMCLRLANLAKCDHLPAFGQLPNLRNFCMEDIPSVRKIGREFYGDEGNCKKLKVIRLERMDNLEEWWTTRSGEEDKEFLIPNLHLLQVTDYPKLSFLPYPPRKQGFGSLVSSTLPFSVFIRNCNFSTGRWGRLEHLATLEIFYAKGCSGSRTLLDIIKCFLSLRVLHLISQEDMEILPEWLGQLVSLDEINIDNCRNLTSLPKSIQNLPALRELWLRERKGLEILPEGLGQLASLKKLLIMDCPKLTFLPESMMNLTGLEELWLGGFNSLPEWIGQLSCLKEINIFDSPNMTCLLESMQNLNNLKKLYIWNCPRLIERCRQEDANKISHIPRVILDGKRVIPGQAIEGPEVAIFVPRNGDLRSTMINGEDHD
uniref:Disease resistance R13L4/SHOC-2-like LRR domain-containing protein n=1 Tax=Oryza brachyantha TaxID=4533 RepID=J3L7N5_ORYBR